MHKYLLLIVVLLSYGCKKDAPYIDTVGTLTGAYVGRVITATETFTFNGTPQYQRDTTDNGIHTITITKISADSFVVTNTSGVNITHSVWKYTASGNYARGKSQSGSSTFDQVTFVPAVDSLYVVFTFSAYDKAGSHSSYKTSTYFSGKKQ